VATNFSTGGLVTAANLRDRCFPLVSFVNTDQTVNNNATIQPVVGLTGALEGKTYYAFDGVIFFSTNGTADIKFTVQAPFADVFDSEGAWSLFGSPATVTPPGNVSTEFDDQFNGSGDITAAGTLTAGGSAGGQNVALPRGWVRTHSSPGTVQWWFAQEAADASNTTIRAGSWIRFSKLGLVT
jgi:hypothetical protein